MPGISTYKKSDTSPKYSIKSVDKKDIGDVVSLINEYNSGLIHFVPFTAQAFESRLKSIPSYGLDNFWVVRDDSTSPTGSENHLASFRFQNTFLLNV